MENGRGSNVNPGVEGSSWRRLPRSPLNTPDLEAKWLELFYRQYEPKRPMVPLNYEELDLLLEHARHHHERCKIKNWPEQFQDLSELQERGRNSLDWTWNSYCEAAFRKLECHLFMHAVFDEWPLKRATGWYKPHQCSKNLAKFKSWMAWFHGSAASMNVERWPSPYYELIDFIRVGEVNWTEANLLLFKELNNDGVKQAIDAHEAFVRNRRSQNKLAKHNRNAKREILAGDENPPSKHRCVSPTCNLP